LGTDWFKNRTNEIERLLDHVESILGNDPDYGSELDAAKKTQDLRQQLMELRDNEIAL